ncbi:MAG: tautomerase family protein [Propionibacterium sp.]
MPLVRIDLQEGRTPGEVRTVADTVQEVMREVFAAPPRDRYQIVTVHPRGQIIAEDSGLGFSRSDDIVIIQIFQQGRTRENKVAAYALLAERLHERTGLDPNDLVVSIMTNDQEDWSFCAGEAQFLDGTL